MLRSGFVGFNSSVSEQDGGEHFLYIYNKSYITGDCHMMRQTQFGCVKHYSVIK